MLPTQFWEKELLEDFRGRKALIIKFLFPLLLLVPIFLSSAPNYTKTDFVGVMVLFIGVFGAAVGLIRTKESKMLERLAVSPLNPGKLLMEYIFAKSVFAILQLLLPLVLLLVLNPIPILSLVPIFAFYIVTILTANAIGVLVAIISGSSGEVHLFAALIVLAIGGLSGFFINMTSGILVQIGQFSPFSALSIILLGGGIPWFSLITFVIIFFFVAIFSGKLFRFE